MMFISIIVFFILGIVIGVVISKNGTKKNIDEPENKELHIETSMEDVSLNNETENKNVLQKLVEDHNKAMTESLEKLRINSKSVSKKEENEEIEYDEAVFI